MTMRRMAVVGILILIFSLAVTNAFAQFKDDMILSNHVKEADGTSGQDTNAGSGIKTDHIQNGAVTDAKITGPIAASKIQKPTNVVVVAKSGGDFTDPVTAINSIADASASNPYLLRIMPGVYDLTSPLVMKEYVDIEGSGETVTKLQTSNNWYMVSGSNNAEIRDLTILNEKLGAIQNIGIYSVGTAPSINDVTVIVSGATNSNVAVFNYQGASTVMKHVTAMASGGGEATAIANSYNCSTIIENSTARADNGTGSAVSIGIVSSTTVVRNVQSTASANSGYALAFAITGSSMAVLENVTGNAGGGRGIYIQASTATIKNSTISGASNSIASDSGILNIANTELSGPIQVFGSPNFRCFNAYDNTFQAVTCP